MTGFTSKTKFYRNYAIKALLLAWNRVENDVRSWNTERDAHCTRFFHLGNRGRNSRKACSCCLSQKHSLALLRAQQM
jgi:hypothetical protein